MRILLVSFVEDTTHGGMGKWSHRMSAQLFAMGHTPTLWFSDRFHQLKRYPRASVLLFPLVLAFRLWEVRADFDVIVIHEPSGAWYALLRRAVNTLPPMIAMCHNVESKCFAEIVAASRRGDAVLSMGNRIRTPAFRLWQSRLSIRLADHVVCLSSVDREYLVHNLRCSPTRITVQTNGVDEAASCALQSLPPRRVLFVGGWLDVKGRRLLPRIWSTVHDQFPDASLTIIGTGVSQDSVLADFGLRLRHSITVIPRVTSESEMSAHYRCHDIFLMPSLSEGSPLSLLEAMSAGLAVVAARVGGIPDLVRHEEHGLLFDVSRDEDGAAMVCQLMSEPRLTARLAVAGADRSASLSWDSAARSLLSAVMTVANHP